MLDLVKQYFENLNDRIRSPILGSATAVFVAINWKPLYFFLFSNFPVQIRIWYFELHTSIYSLLVYPISLGVIIGLFKPWLTLFSAWAAIRPNYYLHNLQQIEASKREIQKLQIDAEHEQAKADLERESEERKIAAAERLEKAASVSGELEEELKRERSKSDGGIGDLPSALVGDSIPSVVNRQVLIALGKAKGSLTRSQLVESVAEVMDGEKYNFGSVELSEPLSVQRISVEAAESLGTLNRIGLVTRDTTGARSNYQLSSTGYGVFDLLVANQQ